ncbi:MAG: DUF3422 domain-containing protein [Rhodoferax sp.]|nr:DUF3422 domain-containing protein [Rhodoferax sp.]
MHSHTEHLPLLPPNDVLRTALHNEVHARPPANLQLPALVVFVAVLNEGVSRQQEWEHLRQLPGQDGLALEALNDNFVRLRPEGYTVKYERHTEFTRYSLVQLLPSSDMVKTAQDLAGQWVFPSRWLHHIPGTTVAAVTLALVHGDLTDLTANGPLMEQARQWLGGTQVVASLLGGGHSCALTEFQIGEDGFERMLVVAPLGISQSRAGRISQRLLEIETYRLMALRGLPVAKALGPMLAQAEAALSNVTARLESKAASDQELLDDLVALAAQVERAIAEHGYRFSATQAYYTLVGQRIAELREKVVPGMQTIGEFMQRRLSPAMATVAAASQRLVTLSERVSRTSSLLRTRVDIASEQQNQQLLEKLTRGQELQLRLQTTVEGLSIAAISYYVVSLLYYGTKALHSAGLPVNPDIATGALIPLVLAGVWRMTRRIHAALHSE